MEETKREGERNGGGKVEQIRWEGGADKALSQEDFVRRRGPTYRMSVDSGRRLPDSAGIRPRLSTSRLFPFRQNHGGPSRGPAARISLRFGGQSK